MKNIIKDHYATYHDSQENRPERHIARFVLFVFFAFILSIMADSLDAAHTMMATGLSILIGFVYGGLFSGNAMGSADLPVPKSITDEVDYNRLCDLSNIFRVRSIYFISLSIFEVVILAVVSLSYKLPNTLSSAILDFDRWVDRIVGFQIFSAFNALTDYFSLFVSFVIFLVFFEGIYTFYRISTVLVELVQTRQEYLEGQRKT